MRYSYSMVLHSLSGSSTSSSTDSLERPSPRSRSEKVIFPYFLLAFLRKRGDANLQLITKSSTFSRFVSSFESFGVVAAVSMLLDCKIHPISPQATSSPTSGSYRDLEPPGKKP